MDLTVVVDAVNAARARSDFCSAACLHWVQPVTSGWRERGDGPRTRRGENQMEFARGAEARKKCVGIQAKALADADRYVSR